MKTSVRYGLRFVAALGVVAALSLTSTLLAPAGPAGGPYTSALSSLAASQVLAASTCNFKACAGGSRHNIVCAKVTTPFQCSTYQGFCLNQNCP